MLSSVNKLLEICLRQEHRLLGCTCGCRHSDPTFMDCYSHYTVRDAG
jgi:hypothetical protein